MIVRAAGTTLSMPFEADFVIQSDLGSWLAAGLTHRHPDGLEVHTAGTRYDVGRFERRTDGKKYFGTILHLNGVEKVGFADTGEKAPKDRLLSQSHREAILRFQKDFEIVFRFILEDAGQKGFVQNLSVSDAMSPFDDLENFYWETLGFPSIEQSHAEHGTSVTALSASLPTIISAPIAVPFDQQPLVRVLPMGLQVNVRDICTDHEFKAVTGIINREAIRAFSRGQCHALAYALSEQTGWPIVGIGEALPKKVRDRSYPFSSYCYRHYLVLTPDRSVIDIRGRRSIGQLRTENWGASSTRLGLATAEEMRWALADSSVREEHYMQRARLDLARAFVPAVLRQAGYRKEARAALRRLHKLPPSQRTWNPEELARTNLDPSFYASKRFRQRKHVDSGSSILPEQEKRKKDIEALQSAIRGGLLTCCPENVTLIMNLVDSTSSGVMEHHVLRSAAEAMVQAGPNVPNGDSWNKMRLLLLTSEGNLDPVSVPSTFNGHTFSARNNLAQQSLTF